MNTEVVSSTSFTVSGVADARTFQSGKSKQEITLLDSGGRSWVLALWNEDATAYGPAFAAHAGQRVELQNYIIKDPYNGVEQLGTVRPTKANGQRGTAFVFADKRVEVKWPDKPSSRTVRTANASGEEKEFRVFVEGALRELLDAMRQHCPAAPTKAASMGAGPVPLSH